VLNSRALTKIQTAILITVIGLAAVGGVATYFTVNESVRDKNPYRVGVCADLDQISGKAMFRGATLAVEQINAAGGLLGRNLTVVAEDDDAGTPPFDLAVATNALNRLISVDKADCVIATSGPGSLAYVYQDICSVQKKIHFSVYDRLENLTQRIIDNYDRYKYSFRCEYLPNGTTLNMAHVQFLSALKNATGFTKVGYIKVESVTTKEETISYFEDELPKLGFQIVYRKLFQVATTDFTSYFAQAEAAKAQILFVIGVSPSNCAGIVKEWYNRQSPMLLCGDMTAATDWDFWNYTSGTTEFVLTKSTGLTIGYPITSQTAAAKDAFLARWGVPMQSIAAAAYDVVKFLLADAINRAKTTDTDAVIKALETVRIDTVLANDFGFTSNHDIYVDASRLANLSNTTLLYSVIQWQNGVQVPIFPESLRKAAGANLQYPPWQGPWSK